MKVGIPSSPLGSPTRTRLMIVLGLVGESYPRELARILQAPFSGVQKALRSLERDGLIAGRTMGRTRVYALDPRYFAYRELQRLVDRLGQPESVLRERVADMRRRPRRAGKPL